MNSDTLAIEMNTFLRLIFMLAQDTLVRKGWACVAEDGDYASIAGEG